MLQKTPPISYPGELPDLSHQTISLRTQLRLSYETYSWLRYLTWTGLGMLGLLLFLVPGGFPPGVFNELGQTLPEIGSLLALHGSLALVSLVALFVGALTWCVCWAVFMLLCFHLGRYSWRLYTSRSQALLASNWFPSSVLTERAIRDPEPLTATLSLTSQRPGTTSAIPTRPIPPPSAPAPQRGVPPPPEYAPPEPRQFAQPATPQTRPRPAALPEEAATTSLNGWPLSHTAGSNTGVAWDTGITRRGKPNEDSVLTMRGTCNFAERLLPFELHIIADGMGGHAHGRLASHLAVRAILETVVPGLVASNTIESEQIVDILIDGVHWANQVIFQYGQEQHTDMGTTITAVLLLDEIAYVINVGDSRTYVYRPGAGLTQITRDHSLVARLVETGAIKPDDVYTHPERNKVYRGLGDKMDVTVDWFVLPVQTGDMLLLCSDGLWEMVRDARIAEILQTYATAPTVASHALLRAALQAGGSDNVSLLVARVQP
jgi:serine/threonine protein phosphatase PrpC